jgi:hydroxymethylpyrimidine pyrophosphatase-like HAD family hydrolase
MSSIDLVVTDLDGTLWGGEEEIHARSLAAVRELARRDVPLLVATGRRRSSAAAGLARAGLAPPAVLLDGALGVDLATSRPFHRRGYSIRDAVAVLDAFLEAGVEPCVYVDAAGAEVLVGEEPATSPRHLRRLGGRARRADLHRAVRRHTVLSFGVVAGDPAALETVARQVAHRARPRVVRDVVFGSVTLMVPPRDVSKWDGVLAFCADRGIDSRRVLAIGDGENDLELLSHAAVACTVSDGCEGALELAGHVIPPAAQGGWGEIVGLL